jgi:transglutaminase-like putative cysteine protease
MPIAKRYTLGQSILQWLLILLPTTVLVTYMLWDAKDYFSFPQMPWMLWGAYFAGGATLSVFVYRYRYRFVTISAALILLCNFIYYYIKNNSAGEFDGFLLSLQFLSFAIFFCTGWIAGYGLTRSRWFAITWSVLLASLWIGLQTSIRDFSTAIIWQTFLPIVLYGCYIIYIQLLLGVAVNKVEKPRGSLLPKILLFICLLLGVGITVFWVFKKDINEVAKIWEDKTNKQGQKGVAGSLVKEGSDGTVGKQGGMSLDASQSGKKKELVFVAHLDNYFPDGTTPNPLYYTWTYYTRFDTSTQTFEIDEHMPSNDLFSPDPSHIPLYFAKTDSNVIKNSRGTLSHKVISTDIYSVKLAPDQFLAPSTAFFCQPIAVDTAFKKQYKSAFRAKMWVSSLNSAYFIYNPAGKDAYQLQQFQQRRFDTLRQVLGWDMTIDTTFFKYYTYMPKGGDYDTISALAKRITQQSNTPIDKILAIREYFKGTDELGQPLFKYTDNPGVPGIPSANKLTYFLLENRKGYCAYFAGATLFLLRSLGIPSRIAAGFLTVDRASKNPGWYWFYQDQAHAWVQVYFPGYGWIDFDTTVPDLNTQEAPQPDGTPPLQMQNPQWVAKGVVQNVDVNNKLVTMQVGELLFKDQQRPLTQAMPSELDVHLASIKKDTSTISIGDVKVGDSIVAVSYAEAFKNMASIPNESIESLWGRFPKPLPVDELRIIPKIAKKDATIDKPITIKAKPSYVLWIVLGSIGCIVLMLLLLPWLTLCHYLYKAKKQAPIGLQAHRNYRAVLFYLYQVDKQCTRNTLFVWATTVIDPTYQTQFANFIQCYHQLKYSTQPLSNEQVRFVQTFAHVFMHQTKQTIIVRKRIWYFMQPMRTIAYLYTKGKVLWKL